jgi:UDP-N-acetylmuramoylalanine--D-glutamate ligase
MNKNKQKLGIWGLGAVGSAAIKALHEKFTLAAMNQTEPSAEIQRMLSERAIQFHLQKDAEEFFINNDLVLPSPGIDLRPFTTYKNKFICELDLYAQLSQAPSIGITGTVGKTTITYCLSELLKREHNIFVGGNIGTGLLQALEENKELTIFELSSFQLEFTKQYAPDLAIITNLFPNHLDRHASFEDYKQAKYNLLRQQTVDQKALVPLELAVEIQTFYQGTLAAVALKKPEVRFPFPIFYAHNNQIYRTLHNETRLVCSEIPPSGFIHNWIIVGGALDLLEKKIDSLAVAPSPILEHRLELCSSKNNISIYNDSKSTIMESTLAAIEQLKNRPIILLLGGLSKGVDRTAYIPSLRTKVQTIICFGTESKSLQRAALNASIPAFHAATLEEALKMVRAVAENGDQILLSPGGSSFDLYSNYKERGKHFKQLVQDILF